MAPGRKPKQLRLFEKNHPTIKRTDFAELEAKKNAEQKRLAEEKLAKLKKKQDLLKPKQVSETYTEFQKALNVLTAIDAELKNLEQSKINMRAQLRIVDDYERRELSETIDNLKPDYSKILPKPNTIEYTFYRIIETIVRDPKFEEIKKDYENQSSRFSTYSKLTLTGSSLDALIKYCLNHKLLTGGLYAKISRLLKFLKAFNYPI
jgi:hypothetical protein